MKITKDIEDFGRDGYAIFLLESSGYSDVWKAEIERQIFEGTPDDIEEIIQDLLLNQVDKWNNFRLKDINRRLDEKC